jgi:hypothetical protein
MGINFIPVRDGSGQFIGLDDPFFGPKENIMINGSVRVKHALRPGPTPLTCYRQLGWAGASVFKRRPGNAN